MPTGADMTEDPLRKRAGHKACVTKTLRHLKRFIAEKSVLEVQSALPKAKTALEAFESCHEEYVRDVTDELQLQKEEAYFEDVHGQYLEAVNDAHSFLEQKKGSSTCAPASEELLKTINLPKVELQTFDGDPMAYHVWFNTFNELVHGVKMDDSAKLTRLLQYTSGRARDAIKGCALADDGYQEALKILKSRFGDNHLVTDAMVTSLREGKPVKTPEQIQQLADDLSLCLRTLKKATTLSEVEGQSFILCITRRLPVYMQVRWKRDAVDKKRDEGRYPSFADFCGFVTKEAENANDPVYGKLLNKSESSRPTKEEKRAYSTQVKNSGSASSSKERTRSSGDQHLGRARDQVSLKRCPFCSGTHKLLFCNSFLDKSVNERLDFVNNLNLCHVCLMDNHVTSECKRSYVCTIVGCGARHSKHLHVPDSVPTVSNGENHVTLSNACTATACIPYVQVRVEDLQAFAVLDSGSDATFCSRKLANSIGIKGEAFSLVLNTLKGREHCAAERVNLKVQSDDDSESLLLTNVIVIDKIPLNAPDVSFKEYDHLREIDLRLTQSDEADLLIGQDNAEALLPLEVRKGSRGEPFAVRTLFGWSLNGPIRGMSTQVRTSHFISTMSSPSLDQRLDEQVELWWNVENEGLGTAKAALSREDEQVLSYWDDQCEIVDGHFQLPIPWKPCVSLPNNRSLALKRLMSLRASLLKRGLYNAYDCEIKRLLEKGYAERVQPIRVDDDVFYLPHHLVMSDRKPGKLRVVYDCAASFQGESLNDKCYSGPDLANRLLHVLLRFRQHEFAFSADVEAMYYQVLIPESQRDALRFLWFDGDGRVEELRMTRHVFGGVWCASSAVYALRRTASHDSISPAVRDVVLRSFYVDDCLHCASTEKECMELAISTKQVLQQRGFRLTKFVTNSEELFDSLPESECAGCMKEIPADSKVLGVKWGVTTDDFYFEYAFDACEEVTRRQMLQVVSSIFDPLGLISPITVRGKVLLQAAVRLKCAWDVPVPACLLDSWNAWLSDMNAVTQLRFPRCIKPICLNDCDECTFHHFSDASEMAMGCCSYLQIADSAGRVHVSLVVSKSKVAPLKKMTIPRLELEAAVLAVKIDVMMRREMDIPVSESHFWVDSEIVLKYILNESRRFQTFVANRVSFIHQHTDVKQWHHVGGQDNVADLISRGQLMHQIDDWVNGPGFLLQPKDWKQIHVGEELFDDPELKREKLVLATASDQIHPIEQLCEYHSQFFPLCKALAWLLRLKAVLRQADRPVPCPLTLSEMKSAEVTLIKHVQSLHFATEIECLSEGRRLNTSSSIRKLDPFIDDDGILRVGGRLRRADTLAFDAHPILIPHKHPLASIIIAHYHNQAHLGTEWVMCRMRRKYWVTRARVLIKKVAHQCVTCKKLFGTTCSQKMADLPQTRLKPHEPAFSRVAIDCFGPFIVKRARSEVKRYGCIFGCMATRAVHLELLDDMSTDSFLNAFRRFVARRSLPREVWSDCGTNFVGGQRAMFRLDEELIRKYSLAGNVEWHFNVPTASHMGGVWERLIRTVRKVLAGVIPRNARLTDESFRTVLCEVEAILNSRPLTKMSDDVSDPAPLTPNNLLLLNGSSALAPGVFQEADVYRRRWKCVQHIANEFWRRWLVEYLPQLQKRVKWSDATRNLQVGDLVLLSNEGTPRGVWPMAIVVQTFPSHDSLVRSVRLRLKNGTEVNRPITKCILLESS